MAIEASNYRARVSGTRLGFVDLTLTHSGLHIRDCVHHSSHGKEWVQLPARVQLDQDGIPRRDDKGKLQYTKMISFASERHANAFRERSVEAVHALLGRSRCDTDDTLDMFGGGDE